MLEAYVWLEVLCKLSHDQHPCGAGWAVVPVCKSSAAPLEPGRGALLAKGCSWAVRTASCPTLIHGLLGQLERSRTVSDYKLQTNITIQYSNFSPLLLNSIGYTRAAQATTNRSLKQEWKVWQGRLKQFLNEWQELHFYSEQTAESHVWTSYSESTWIAEGIKEWK